MAIDFTFTVFGHDEDAGYGFKTKQRADWEELIKRENGAIRPLSDADRESRILISPLDESSLAIVRSQSIKSDGRSALVSASMLIESRDGPVRWNRGFLPQLEAYIQSGYTTVEQEHAEIEDNFPLSMYQLMMPNERLTGVHQLSRISIDEIMALWSMYPPNKRATVEIVVGAIDEDEEIAEGWLRLQVFEEGSGKPIGFAFDHWRGPFSLSADKATADGLYALTRAAILADETGIKGTEWYHVIASEMHRRGHPVTEMNLLPIRIKLALLPSEANRKGLWRRCALESMRVSAQEHYAEFAGALGPLSADELGGLESHEVKTVLVHHLEELQATRTQGQATVTLINYVPVVEESAWKFLVQCSKPEQWFDGKDLAGVHRLMGQLFRRLPQVMETFCEKIHGLESGSRQNVQAMFIRFLFQERVRIPKGSSLEAMLLTMQAPDGLTGQSSASVSEHALFQHAKHLVALDWEDLNGVLLHAANLHLQSGTDACVSFIRDFAKVITSSTDQREHLTRLFRAYLNSLEVHFKQHQTRLDAPLLEQVSLFVSTSSWWFGELFKRPPSEVDHAKILAQRRLKVDELPHAIQLEYYRQKHGHRGWPSPFSKIDERDAITTSVLLSIQPTVGQRVNRMVGWLVMTGLTAAFLTGLYMLLSPRVNFLPELLTINEWPSREVLLGILAALLVPIVYLFLVKKRLSELRDRGDANEK